MGRQKELIFNTLRTMKKKKKLLVAGIALSVLFSTNLQAQTVNYTPFETKESQKIVNELYNRMTLEEKVAQLHGIVPGSLVDKNGKLSDEKCRKNIPNGKRALCH